MTTKSANQNTVEQFVVCSNRATCEKKAPCLRRERFRVTEDLPNPDGWYCVWIDGRPCKWVPYQTHNAAGQTPAAHKETV